MAKITWQDFQDAKRERLEHERSLNPLPVCPTCGVTEVRKISSAEKVSGAVTLGFFSNKRKQQFECLNPNCRYRW